MDHPQHPAPDIKKQMDLIYNTIPVENIPWNMETPPEILQNLIKTGVIKPCRAIELGCGIGNYVKYLAEQGFQASGVDISVTAIEMAIESSAISGPDCNFITADVCGDLSVVDGIYDFAYDWELLHHIFPDKREKYISNVHNLLDDGGKYMSVCFSEDSPQFGGEGKYRTTPLGTELYFSSESELRALFSPLFEIEELKTVEVAGKYAPHMAVYAFMRKKSE